MVCYMMGHMEKNRMPNVRNVAKYHAHTLAHTHTLDLHMMTKCAQTAANNEKCFQPAAFAGTGTGTERMLII